MVTTSSDPDRLQFDQSTITESKGAINTGSISKDEHYAKILDDLHGINEKYKNIRWESYHPGGRRGKNEAISKQMFNDLKAILPERRPNTGPDAVVTDNQYNGNPNIRKYS